MTQSITKTHLCISDIFRTSENKLHERRSELRIPAFCEVFDQQNNFLGVSLDLTRRGVCLSLPNNWTSDASFSVTLKRMDNSSLADVTISVKEQWREARNDIYDTIGGRIVEVDSESNLEALINYCQEVGPDGLC